MRCANLHTGHRTTLGVDWRVNQQEGVTVSERLAIAGSGAIACGLAAVAATRGQVTVFARSDGSCDKADAKVHAICERLGARVNGNVRVSRDPAVAARRDVRRRGDRRGPATPRPRSGAPRPSTSPTTPCWPRRPPRCRSASSRAASGHPERFVGLHVFNPVPKMDLVELAFPAEATERHARARPRAVRGAGQDRGRGARTRRASSSTACCSRSCSRPCG